MLIQKFVNDQIDQLKPSTLDRYYREIKLFSSIYDPQKVEFSDLLQYFDKLSQYYQSQHLAVVKSSLLRYFDFLVLEGKRNDNPIKNIQLKKTNKEVKHHELLSTEELDLIFEDRKERYELLVWRNKLLLSLIRYQGLTNADLLRLTIEDIKGGKLKIEAHSNLKGNIFKLEGIQVEYFYEWKAVRSIILKNESSKLFLNKRGFDITSDGITSVIDTLKPVFPSKRINNKVLRASVIAEHLRKGNNLLETQQFARHKWTSTTMKYKNELNDYSEIIQTKHPYNFM